MREEQTETEHQTISDQSSSSSVHLTCCLLLIGGGQCSHYLEHLLSLMELLSAARVRELRTESGGVLPAYIRSLTLQTARTLTEHSDNEFLW